MDGELGGSTELKVIDSDSASKPEVKKWIIKNAEYDVTCKIS